MVLWWTFRRKCSCKAIRFKMQFSVSKIFPPSTSQSLLRAKAGSIIPISIKRKWVYERWDDSSKATFLTRGSGRSRTLASWGNNLAQPMPQNLLLPLGTNKINVPLKHESLDRWPQVLVPTSPSLLCLVCRSWRIFWVNTLKLTLPTQSPGHHQCLSGPGPWQAPGHGSGMDGQNLQPPALKEQNMRKHICQAGVLERR